MDHSLTARDAALRILAEAARQPSLRVPLDDALGHVLAHDLTSPLDIPAHTNSAMDGYACRGQDVRGASAERPVRLTVVEQIPAGYFPKKKIGPGECARIFTGAALPAGADSVVRQEDTDLGAAVVSILKDRDAGINFRHAGEDLKKGALALPAGQLLGPAELGVLASLAVAHPMVVRRPRVGILGSGDEIVDVDSPEEILSGRKVASSNTHTLVALVKQAGGEPVNLGIAGDTKASLREHLERAFDCDLLVTSAGISVGEHDFVKPVLEELGAELRFWKLRMRPGAPVGFGVLRGIPWVGLPGNPVNLGIARDTKASLREHLERAFDCDLLVTSAGISVGEHDFVKPVLEELGAELRFWKLRMRPGAPVGFGVLRGIPWVGLPGNPVSTMVTFELFVRPAIRKMAGHALPFRRSVPVRAAEKITLGPKLQHFLRAVVSDTPNGAEARLTGPQGSGILTSMVKANALLVIPEGQHETAAGAVVQALPLHLSLHQQEPGF